MAETIAPTKANLIILKDRLVQLKTGYNVIDKKRTVLIKNLMQLTGDAKRIQEAIKDKFKTAYEKLEAANISMGIRQMTDIALSIKEETDDVKISYESIMGLDVPNVKYKREKFRPNYSLYFTSSYVDEAIAAFREVKYLIYELAQTENKIYKLSREIKKNQKRANALEKIQIPQFNQNIKSITETLEEKDREDFYRLKKVKQLKN